MSTIYFADGFDHYTTAAQLIAKWKPPFGTSFIVAPTTTYKRTGTQSFRAGNDYLAKVISSINNGTAIYVHAAAYITSSGGIISGVAWNPANQSSTECYVRVNANGSVEALRGSMIGGTQLAISDTGDFVFNTWNHFIIKFIVNDAGGEVVVKLNGETIINYSGDTKQNSNSAINSVHLGSSSEQYFDDFVIADSDLGDVRVITKYPDADSATHTSWTKGTGSDGYALLDETTPNDDTSSDYIYSTTSGHKSTFSFQAVGLTGTVKGVQLNLRAKKINTGTRAIRGMARVSSTDYEDTNTKYLPSDAYSNSTHVWDNNPNTAAAWAVSEIDASEFGVDVEV